MSSKGWPNRSGEWTFQRAATKSATSCHLPSAISSCLSWDWFAAAWSASLALLLCSSFFSRDRRGIWLLARFLFGARGIPDQLLGSCGYCACDIRCQLGRVRRALYDGSHSAEDWELVLRPDFAREFLSCLSEPGIGVAEASCVLPPDQSPAQSA